MKILATSDTHGELPTVGTCDILLMAGDICPVRSSHAPKMQYRWILDRFIPWLETVPAKQIVFIGGNHDFVLEPKGQGTNIYNEFRQKAIAALPSNTTYLQDSAVEIEGLKIYGYPWVPKLTGWAFFSAYGERAHNIPDCDILLSHGPPLGYSDKVSISHEGCPQLTHVLATRKIKHMVCGHIHEGYGFYKHPDGTAVWNVSHNDRTYQPVNPIVEIRNDV